MAIEFTTNPIMLAFQIKSNQFNNNVEIAITGAIKGTSRRKFYQELGFKSLKDRRSLG